MHVFMYVYVCHSFGLLSFLVGVAWLKYRRAQATIFGTLGAEELNEISGMHESDVVIQRLKRA